MMEEKRLILTEQMFDLILTHPYYRGLRRILLYPKNHNDQTDKQLAKYISKSIYNWRWGLHYCLAFVPVELNLNWLYINYYDKNDKKYKHSFIDLILGIYIKGECYDSPIVLPFYIDMLRMGSLPKSYKDCIAINQMFEI